MKKRILNARMLLIGGIVMLGLMNMNKVSATSISVSGLISVNTVWSVDTVKVTGDVTVVGGISLTINPRVLVQFQGHYKLNVLGCIRANGSFGNMIRFTVRDTTGFTNINQPNGGWYGIRFDNTLALNDSSYLLYCYFEYGKASGTNDDANGGALFVKSFSKLVVSNCNFDHDAAKSNGGAIYLRKSNAVVFHNVFSSNKAVGGAGIYFSSGNAFVCNNTFVSNYATSGGGGLFCADTATCTLTGNLIEHNLGNLGGGVGCLNSNPSLINNTEVYNRATHGGALCCMNASPVLKNNILYYNTGSGTGNQVSMMNNGCNPNFFYCDIQGDSAAFGGPGSTTYTGLYQNNISASPEFTDTLANNYLIKHISPCMDAGKPDTSGLKLPSTDIAGNPRINMGRIDIGSYERQQVANYCGTIAQNTTWNADTIKVMCDLTINNGATLLIVPGVYVEMQDTFKIFMKGCLLAAGSADDTITFAARPGGNVWKGIQFSNVNPANDTSKFLFCKIKDAHTLHENGGAMRFDHSSKAIISNCVFTNNAAYHGGALSLKASSPSVYSTFMWNNQANFSFGKGGAIYCEANSAPVIKNLKASQNTADLGGGLFANQSSPYIYSSIFTNNFSFDGGGIYLDTSYISLMNCIVVNNYTLNNGGGMMCFNSSPIITNTTIANNNGDGGGGALCTDRSSPIFINCVLYGDVMNFNVPNEVYIKDTFSFPEFYYCNIKNDTAGFIYDTINPLPVTYENNIDTLPGFMAPTTGPGESYNGLSADWSLQGCSPMFNKGIPDTLGLGLTAFDYAGNKRVFADTVDIGAYEIIQPYFTGQPHDTAICSGGNVSFTVSVHSSITIGYQWQVKPNLSPVFVNAGGPTANDPIYIINGVTALQNGDKYRCLITANCSQQAISLPATLTVYTAPAITVQPVNEIVCQGDTSHFNVTAGGSVLTYQWQQRPFGSATWTNCIGGLAATAHYSFPNTPLSYNNYSYRCIIHGTCLPGDTTVEVTLTVKGLPAFVTQPGNIGVCAGSDATFTITASGAGLTYQWQISTNGGTIWNNINGQTTTSTTITAVTLGMSGNKYRCIATGDCPPPAISAAGTLTVNTPAAISQQPTDQNACVNSVATFTVTATGGNLSFQWQLKAPADLVWSNATGLSALTATYQINNISLLMNGNKYRCQIGGSCPPGTMSDSVVLHVHPLPSFWVGPDTSVLYSHSIILDAGSGFSGYEWSSGELTQTITVVGSAIGIGTHQYTCTVTDANGCKNSDALIVTVLDDAGLQENGDNLRVKIWPNPANDIVRISFGDKLFTDIHLLVLNMLGEKVTEIFYNENAVNELYIRLKGKNPGIYFLRIETPGYIITRKITLIN